VTLEPLLTNFVAYDLLAWQEQGVLKLSPKFQRRTVWKPAARSYFIDTLLQGYPVPPIHIRLSADPRQGAIREVVDGQQRLRALFDFIGGKFRLSRHMQMPWSGKTYSQLSQQEIDRILMYKFHVYQYQGIDDPTVLQIFARMNTYAVPANPQELRNGRFFGYFKQSVYDLAIKYLQFWRDSKIFTEAGIARMREAELVSELLVMQLDGLQDKKNALDSFYVHLDDEWGHDPIYWTFRKAQRPLQWLSRQVAEERFHEVMGEAVETVGDILPNSEFSRPPLFYTLYSALYHRLFGLPGFDLSSGRKPLNGNSRLELRAAVEDLSELLTETQNVEDLSGWRRDFVVSMGRQTDNVGPRRQRLSILWNQANLGS
jgi:hypothetical protein